MKRLQTSLEGKKTYIGAVIIFISGGLNALCSLPEIGICLSEEWHQNTLIIGVAIATVGFRSAISKLLNK